MALDRAVEESKKIGHLKQSDQHKLQCVPKHALCQDFRYWAVVSGGPEVNYGNGYLRTARVGIGGNRMLNRKPWKSLRFQPAREVRDSVMRR